MLVREYVNAKAAEGANFRLRKEPATLFINDRTGVQVGQELVGYLTFDRYFPPCGHQVSTRDRSLGSD